MPHDLKLVANDVAKSQKIFQSEKVKIERILGKFNVIIEHIGSTSFPKSIGKGIIDMIVACDDETDQHKIRDLLVEHGYRQGELDKKPDGRLFFCNTPGQTQAGDIHLHLVIKNSPNFHEVIKFREYFLSHPDAVKKYNQEKLNLAKQTNNDRKKYLQLKGEFMQSVLKKL